MTLVELLNRMRRASTRSPLTVVYHGTGTYFGPNKPISHSFSLMYGGTSLASLEIEEERVKSLIINMHCPWEFAQCLLALKQEIDSKPGQTF